MDEFISEPIDVERASDGPAPARFMWRGQNHEVSQVIRSYVDIGYGDHPPMSRRWYTRRHRRYYTVKDASGAVYQMYLDYSNKSKPTWWLVKRLEQHA